MNKFLLKNVRQTPMFANHLKRMGWLIEQIDSSYFFIRKLPFLPPVVKLQRPNQLPTLTKIYSLLEKYRAKRCDVEPLTKAHRPAPNIKPMLHPYNQTKTILIDLSPTTSEIFDKFSSAKRRAVRRAEKNQVQIEVSQNVRTPGSSDPGDYKVQSEIPHRPAKHITSKESGTGTGINEFIKIKNKSAGWILPVLTNWTVKPLWKEFAPKNAAVLLAYVNNETGKKSVLNMSSRSADWRREIPLGISHFSGQPDPFEMTNGDMARSSGSKKYLGGILLLYYDKCAYYWMAGYTKEAKQLATPSLLVWEALKFAKKMGCIIFDFEGVYDERLPQVGKDWQGFTKFKSGFGGKEFLYPLPYHIYLPK